jgi:hypothetical protein
MTEAEQAGLRAVVLDACQPISGSDLEFPLTTSVVSLLLARRLRSCVFAPSSLTPCTFHRCQTRRGFGRCTVVDVGAAGSNLARFRRISSASASTVLATTTSVQCASFCRVVALAIARGTGLAIVCGGRPSLVPSVAVPRCLLQGLGVCHVGAASIVVRLSAFPRTWCGSVRTCANSVLIAMVSTTVVVGSVLISLSDRFFVRPLRLQWSRVAARSLPYTHHSLVPTGPCRGLWGPPTSSAVDADGAGSSCRGRSTSP